MNLFRRFWNSVFSRKLSEEIDAEMAAHLELLEAEERRKGLDEHEAWLAARKRFGSQAKHFEYTREADLAGWLGEFAQDMRFALRQMRKNLGFTLIAVSVIALGIGAVTTVYSLVHAVLLDALPYQHPERLVYLWTPNAQLGATLPQEVAPSYPDFYDWQRLNRSFSAMTVMNHRMVNLAEGGGARRVSSAFVNAGFFETLGVKPELGRAIGAEDDRPGHEHVAVIGDALWREQFGGRREAIGRMITFDRQKYTVIGVMPEAFGYPFEGDVPFLSAGFKRTSLWIPLALNARQKTDRRDFDNGDAAIARLKPGVSVEEAQSDLAAIEKGLDLLYPPEGAFARGWGMLIRPLVDTIFGPVSKMLWLLLAAVGCVLLIACGNVANLLLARVSGRRGEIALRAGLGAGRGRLARQMITESLTLAMLGGAWGVLLSFGAVRVLALMNPGNIPRFDQTAVNLPVLALAAAVTLFSGIFFGFAPALAAWRPDLNELLRSGTQKTVGSASRLRHAFIAAEVGLSFVLLAGAMLLIRSYIKLDGQNTGFVRSTLTMQLALDQKYSRPEEKIAFFLRYLDRLRGLPGVTAAGAGDSVPLEQYVHIGVVTIKGYGQTKIPINAGLITPGYFEALGTRLLAGRFFEERDLRSKTRDLIVNEAFVKAFFRGGRAIGQQVRLGPSGLPGPWGEVVGVVANIKNTTLEEKARPEYFSAYRLPFEAPDMSFAVRSKVPAETLIPEARKILHELDPALALSDVRTMKERVADVNAKRRFQMVLLTAFAGLAVFLAMIGIYGVMAYSVKQRTSEIGLRMALGASQGQVLRMIVKQGLAVVLIGLAGGIGAGLLLTRVIQASLYGVPARDPVTFILVPLLVLAVACGACLLPAFEASRVDPAVAIRNE